MAQQEVKRMRLQTKFDAFHDFSEREKFSSAYRSMLVNKKFSLVAEKITRCNANAENKFISFRYADCRATPQLGEFYAFESIFKDGVTILNDLTAEHKYVPTDEKTEALVLPLIEFLFDTESYEALRKLNDRKSKDETQLMILLGTHFFSRLAVQKEFTMDKSTIRYSTKGAVCICGNCEKNEVISKFDDTSFGNLTVWHGNLDIMLDSCEVGVHCVSDEDPKPPFRPKVIRNRILSQTITFSFLQKQRHPASTHFMIPSIVATSESIQIFFYDSNNDILLETRELKLFYPDTNLLNYQTIIYTWLVINYKHLCSGPFEGILNAPKSEFPSFAGNALCIYESDLKYGEVTEEKSPPSPSWWSDVDNGLVNHTPLIID